MFRNREQKPGFLKEPGFSSLTAESELPMNARRIVLCLTLICTASVGCHPLKFKAGSHESPLGHRMSELNSSLDRREITLDEFERSKHDILHATGQPTAMNAR